MMAEHKAEMPKPPLKRQQQGMVPEMPPAHREPIVPARHPAQDCRRQI